MITVDIDIGEDVTTSRRSFFFAVVEAEAAAQRFTHREAIGLPKGEARAARCTCGEAVRFPDERCEELCGARSQEAARVPHNPVNPVNSVEKETPQLCASAFKYIIWNRISHMDLCNVAALNYIRYCSHNALFDMIFSQGGYSHG